MKKKTVFVGISGGVDSAVSAAMLKKQGYEVIGVFIRTWHPDFLVCNEEEERHDAMRIAAHLDIPFLTFDLADVYKKEVADYMISEYRLGRTPNGDVMCNKHVKFGAFLKKAIEMGADYVATGHYARIVSNNLLIGRDSAKDQSYFLWTLKQEQIEKILFPIGHLEKKEVRKLAKKFKLPVAEKKDSQGICFLGAVDLKDFLKHYIKEKKGKVLLASLNKNNKKQEEIGFHSGVTFYTQGERHGFTITKKNPGDGAYYVYDKDIKNNILYVTQNKDLTYTKKLGDPFILEINNLNWISEIPLINKNYKAQIRYHGEFLDCKINKISKEKAQIKFKKFISVAPGQSCVLYKGDICLGGGVVV